MKIYYRAYLQRNYTDSPGWRDDSWHFFEMSPEDFIKEWDHPAVQTRIKYLHIISEDDYNEKRIYTKPIEQIIFH